MLKSWEMERLTQSIANVCGSQVEYNTANQEIDWLIEIHTTLI